MTRFFPAPLEFGAVDFIRLEVLCQIETSPGFGLVHLLFVQVFDHRLAMLSSFLHVLSRQSSAWRVAFGDALVPVLNGGVEV